MRPEDLAGDMGIPAKTLRAWLRRTWPRGPVDHGSHWYLTAEQVSATRDHFSGRRTGTRPPVALRQPPRAFEDGPVDPSSTSVGDRARSGGNAAMPFTREVLRNEGFVGFIRLRDLDLREVPEMAGLYVLLREQLDRPAFLARSTGGHFKGKDPTVDPSVLEKRWVDGAHCVYIGMASKTASTSLRRRIKDLRHYGNGHPVGHQGGRFVWQLVDATDYVICWKTLIGDPRAAEIAMIERFSHEHGRRPLGNISG